MKITSIHTHYVRIPFDMGAPKQEFAGLRFPTMDHLLVQVETDAGITGWGEGFGHSIIPATKTALEAYVGAVQADSTMSRGGGTSASSSTSRLLTLINGIGFCPKK